MKLISRRIIYRITELISLIFFFKKLIDGGQNSFYGKNCLHCGDFLTTKVIKNFHNFLKHYEMGFEESTDERPIKVTVRGDITIYNLNYHQHHKYYDFFNAERIVEDLIKQVSYLHKPTEKFQFKADFSIENKQNAVNDSSDMSDIKTLRYWSTDVYQGVYFNSYIASGITNDILKRVINVGLSGSSWYFNRFSHLNLKVLRTHVTNKKWLNIFVLRRALQTKATATKLLLKLMTLK